MKYGKLLNTICIYFLLSGCAATIKTQDTLFDFNPARKLSIGLDKANSRDSDIMVYSALMNESKGTISEYADQPYRLTVALDFAWSGLGEGEEIGLGMLTFILPPLSFIPSSVNATYGVAYAIKDQYDGLILERFKEGTVEGEVKGWYIGRSLATKDLIKMEKEFVAKKVAHIILSDIKDNSELLFAKAEADVNSKDKNGDTKLMIAVRTGRADVVQELLKNRADVNELNNYRFTALMIAAANNRSYIASILIDKGAKINLVSALGNTALLCAAEYGYVDFVKLLLAKGADPALGGYIDAKNGGSHLKRNASHVIEYAQRRANIAQEKARVWNAEQNEAKRAIAVEERRRRAEESSDNWALFNAVVLGVAQGLEQGMGGSFLYPQKSATGYQSSSSTACSQCSSQCASLTTACKSGGQAACYKAAACECQCRLNAGGCGSARSALQQCVQSNNANANSLKSSAPSYRQ